VFPGVLIIVLGGGRAISGNIINSGGPFGRCMGRYILKKSAAGAALSVGHSINNLGSVRGFWRTTTDHQAVRESYVKEGLGSLSGYFMHILNQLWSRSALAGRASFYSEAITISLLL
jgi:hypothetical protein